MLRRTLLILVVTLAVLCGVTLLVTAGRGDWNLPIAVSPTHKEVVEKKEPKNSLQSGLLSRLPLMPLLSKKKPIVAVMIENHEHAREYQEGIQEALMVQEWFVEGYISRFIALFDGRRMPHELGPVRSLRPYFLDGILPWSRTVFHAGGSPEALERTEKGDEFFGTNLLYHDDENHSLRKVGPLPPHDLFLTKESIQPLLEEVPERYLPAVHWPPYKKGTLPADKTAERISVNFFNPLHNVQFEYQGHSRIYKRTNGGTVSPARPKNVVILEIPIDYIGEYGRLFMTQTGTGPAIVFHSGRYQRGTWNRASLNEPFQFETADGESIKFASGQIWMMVLPSLERVRFE